MSCPNCGHQNDAGSVFCEQCGTRLPAVAAPSASAASVVCGRCGGSNRPDMRFCVHCGNTLQAGAPAPAPAEPAKPTVPDQPPTPVGGAPHPTSVSMAQPQGAAPQAAPQAFGAPHQAPAASPVTAPGGGPICGRCRGVGDSDAEFCKFCGARYADTQGPQSAAAFGATSPGGQSQVPAAPAQAPAAAPAAGGLLVSILKDGSDGQAYPVFGQQTDIGRVEGEITLPDDPYLSPRHVRIRQQGGGYVLQDLASANGVYVRLRDPHELQDHDTLLLGQQVLRFELLDEAEISLGPAGTRGVLAFGTPDVPRYARLVLYTTEGVGRDIHYLYRDETVLGREIGDIVFTDDPFLSRRHAVIKIERATKKVTLRDLGSSNGTAVKLRGERSLQPGDQFRVGRHLFRFDRPGGAR